MLWAWERPENLLFLDCEKAGVAFLAKTITLGSDGMDVRPRLQPLLAPKNCKMVATVRIEAPLGRRAFRLSRSPRRSQSWATAAGSRRCRLISMRPFRSGPSTASYWRK
jgi:hypothetical protein